VTVHHELGHNFYQRAYQQQPYFFQGGANDGFHEAIGDAIALSVTPDYLRRIGLLDSVPSAASDTAMLLRIALDKIAFLPFALALDRWRWGVFSGEITPAHYNGAWWDLKHRYQGVVEPTVRTEQDFDPGAKYHVAANVPYVRYFLARVLQFQFHRSWCRAAGWTGPLYRCSVYGNKAAGQQLARMLAAGQSRPWQDILADATGERQLDATAIYIMLRPTCHTCATFWLASCNSSSIALGAARRDGLARSTAARCTATKPQDSSWLVCWRQGKAGRGRTFLPTRPVSGSSTPPRSISCCGQRAIRALLFGSRLAIPVPSLLVPRGGMDWPALPLLGVRQQSRRTAVGSYAGGRAKPAVAGHSCRRDR